MFRGDLVQGDLARGQFGAGAIRCNGNLVGAIWCFTPTYVHVCFKSSQMKYDPSDASSSF